MPRAISKTDVSFGTISVGAVRIDGETKKLIVGSREFELDQLSPEQADRLDAMARGAFNNMGATTDETRRDLDALVAELISKRTHSWFPFVIRTSAL
ncbi:hypothetical protein AC629_37360 [Bradyrhizobium sp. NAS80.1]|uniref:hypothetical protein n=1 Tax=Bradyrhizobium sp. NAS80.1 TaxID=1680159 RepID=UPI00095EDA37|nr:hypothetical protein [Bradyrhizobium sp. NAS80.1]OKO72825.1 hypothetical protein AC629_37360 [Bradyrhizobium sp. NAS80.1]